MRHWRPVVSGQSLVWLQEQKGRKRSVQAKPSRSGAGALQEQSQQCCAVTVLPPDTQHWGKQGSDLRRKSSEPQAQRSVPAGAVEEQTLPSCAKRDPFVQSDPLP